MIDPKRFIYSFAAVARMLGVKPGMVKKVEVWFNCIFVIVAGRRPRFWKKSSFTSHFVDWRKDQSEFYKVRKISNSVFEVTNGKSLYTLDALLNTIRCTCNDYDNQHRYLKGRGCCKHGYAVLRFLGFDRLSEYIENHRWLNTNDEEIDYDEANHYIFGASHC
ncbi:SWIM zinc finger family protein [Microcoleus sp. N9_B4]|uniref:hypothetical protein n=1 Tax=Microcoleus sp. N9_B4 TaxID=3055386 RepID=UPI002FCE9DA7